jgi:predicted TIM-barrel fold metal-dependent hydrolase
MPAAGDAEGARVPEGLPPVVDAHVHLFPEGVLRALWRWFEAHAWPVRYPLPTPAIVDFLLSRGVDHLVALHYAHKPGMARALNHFAAQVVREQPRVTAVATVLPGEEGALDILREGWALGLHGVKLHCHVQAFAPDDAPHLWDVYALCQERGQPLVMHAGREPASPHYPVDPHQLCSAERVERVLEAFPRLKLCVPHLGADEFDAYLRLLERHDNLWLDTTMAVAGYFPGPVPLRLLQARPERILYGTDFPHLPYAWDRELKVLAGLGLKEEHLALLLGGTARALFSLPESPARRPG